MVIQLIVCPVFSFNKNNESFLTNCFPIIFSTVTILMPSFIHKGNLKEEENVSTIQRQIDILYIVSFFLILLYTILPIPDSILLYTSIGFAIIKFMLSLL